MYAEFIESQDKSIKSTKPDKTNAASKFKQTTLQMTPEVRVNLTMKNLIDGSVEMVTIIGRSYLSLNDSGFRRLLLTQF